MQRLRNGAERARQIPEKYERLYPPPIPESTPVDFASFIADPEVYLSSEHRAGWFKSGVDPMALLASFPTLRLRAEFVLRAYQYYSGGNGNGIVWALPVSVPFPEPDQCPKVQGHFLSPPRPPGALDDLMDAIEGDESARSYLSASLFDREAAEFGALWHGCSWSDERILYENPLDPLEEAGHWEWLHPIPQDWLPEVIISEETITVRFFAHSEHVQCRISEYLDTFVPGNYRFQSKRTEIALGPRGFIY